MCTHSTVKVLWFSTLRTVLSLVLLRLSCHLPTPFLQEVRLTVTLKAAHCQEGFLESWTFLKNLTHWTLKSTASSHSFHSRHSVSNKSLNVTEEASGCGCAALPFSERDTLGLLLGCRTGTRGAPLSVIHSEDESGCFQVHVLHSRI